jgi:hypothetical protein
MNSWLLLHYKLPTHPSALRVSAWRKLKRLGALYHQETVWVLPDTARTREQFRWLAAEIVEMGGEASLWESGLLQGVLEETLIQQFQEQVTPGYEEILASLESGQADLDTLSRQYQQLNSRDYFHAKAGQRAREALLAMRGEII